MDTLTQLWIRACKSNNADIRLRSVARRNFYGNTGTQLIAQELAHIVDKYNPMTSADILKELSQLGMQDLNTEERMVRLLKHRIMFTKKDKLKGLTTPLHFKLKKESVSETISALIKL